MMENIIIIDSNYNRDVIGNKDSRMDRLNLYIIIRDINVV